MLGELDAVDFYLEVLGAPISSSCFLSLLQSSSIHTASWALVRALLKRKLGPSVLNKRLKKRNSEFLIFQMKYLIVISVDL